MSDSVLVDTSVFIDYLRGNGKSAKNFGAMLEQGRVLLSIYVRLELLSGVRSSERKTLASLLNALPIARVTDKHFESAEQLISMVRKKGIACGLLDYLIALQALELQTPLLTLDRVMARTAQIIGVDVLRNW